MKNEILLREFKGLLYTGKENKERRYSKRLLSYGIIVDERIFEDKDEEIEKVLIYNFGKDMRNINSTFYKTIEEVEGKTEEELNIEQFLHYLSTYGVESLGVEDFPIYEPLSLDLERAKELQKDLVGNYTFINSYSLEEWEEKIKNLIYSKVALKEELIKALLEEVERLSIRLDFNLIGNKEFKIAYTLKTGEVSKSFDELVATINYIITRNTMVVKNKDLYRELFDRTLKEKEKEEVEGLLKKYTEKYGEKEIAKNLNRYRKFFIILKKKLDDKTFFNRVLKLSKKVAEPRKMPLLNNFLTADYIDLSIVEKTLEEAPFLQLVRLVELLKEKSNLISKGEIFKSYRIRNGKTFDKIITKEPIVNKNINDRIILLGEVFRRRFIEIIEKEFGNKTFYIPEGVDYKLPTSLKTLIGNVGEFTSFKIPKKDTLSVGMYWEQQIDYDLHTLDLNGVSIGWNSSIKEGAFTFSGDMTRLNKEGYAAEYINIDLTKKDCRNIIGNIIMFSSLCEEDIKPIKIIASTSNTKEEFIDPKNIKLSLPIEIKKGGENKSVFFLDVESDDDFVTLYIINLPNETNKIPQQDELVFKTKFLENKITTKVSLKELLINYNRKVISNLEDLEEDEEFIDFSIENFNLDWLIKY